MTTHWVQQVERIARTPLALCALLSAVVGDAQRPTLPFLYRTDLHIAISTSNINNQLKAFCSRHHASLRLANPTAQAENRSRNSVLDQLLETNLD